MTTFYETVKVDFLLIYHALKEISYEALAKLKKCSLVISTSGRNPCFYYTERFLTSFGMTQKVTFARGSYT